MPLSELVSSSCSNSAQSAYFRSPCSQTSGDLGKRFLVAPGALKRQKIWVRRPGRREKRVQISVRFARRRLQAPTSQPLVSYGQPKQRSKAGQHRLPGASPVETEVKI